jgi:hypothetical protein
LLSIGRDKVRFAKEYEQLNQTSFYQRRNCLTTREIAE